MSVGCVVGDGEVNNLKAFGGDFYGIDNDIIKASLDTGDHAIPFAFFENRFSINFSSNGVSDVDFDTFNDGRIFWVSEYARGAIFGVSSPYKGLFGGIFDSVCSDS